MTNFQFNSKDTENSPSPEEQLQFVELKNQYKLALAEMPENQRTVFLMSRFDKMKYAEIAGLLGLSVKAIEKRMSLALSFLKLKLNQ
jgi:RNA polymerase sigma factor (sigma-70 family)